MSATFLWGGILLAPHRKVALILVALDSGGASSPPGMTSPGAGCSGGNRLT